MPTLTWQFDQTPQGFSSMGAFLEEVSSRPGMSERLAAARKRIAARGEAAKPQKRPLTAMRLRAGLSQKQLADAVGTSQPVISMWEAGDREPTLKNLAALAKALGVTFDDLLPALLVHV